MKSGNNKVYAGCIISGTNDKGEAKKALKTAFSLGAEVPCSYG